MGFFVENWQILLYMHHTERWITQMYNCQVCVEKKGGVATHFTCDIFFLNTFQVQCASSIKGLYTIQRR